MLASQKKKALVITALAFCMIVFQGFAYKDHDDYKPKNLQVLPKDISMKDLDNVMHGFCKSLGVKCGFCHLREIGKDENGFPKFNFASDIVPQKNIARGMMKMVDSINTIYLDRIATPEILAKLNIHMLEHISCVTCHNGNKKPINSVDELKKEEEKN